MFSTVFEERLCIWLQEYDRKWPQRCKPLIVLDLDGKEHRGDVTCFADDLQKTQLVDGADEAVAALKDSSEALGEAVRDTGLIENVDKAEAIPILARAELIRLVAKRNSTFVEAARHLGGLATNGRSNRLEIKARMKALQTARCTMKGWWFADAPKGMV